MTRAYCRSGFGKRQRGEWFPYFDWCHQPAEAAEGTIRQLYASSMGENAVHGSDSDENAAIEAAFHFSGRELF